MTRKMKLTRGMTFLVGGNHAHDMAYEPLVGKQVSYHSAESEHEIYVTHTAEPSYSGLWLIHPDDVILDIKNNQGAVFLLDKEGGL